MCENSKSICQIEHRFMTLTVEKFMSHSSPFSRENWREVLVFHILVCKFLTQNDKLTMAMVWRVRAVFYIQLDDN